MPTLAHVHTYVKYYPNNWKRKDLFKCDDPYCTHFDEKSKIEGKAAICPSCHKEFILTREALRRAKPKCIACTNTKKGQELRAVRELIDSLKIATVEELLNIDPKSNEFDDPQGGL